MIRITIQAEGYKRHLDDALGRFVRTTPIKIRRKISEKMRESKRGRMYARRKGSGFRRFHRASAAGEAPAHDTGAYERSLQILYPRTLEGVIQTSLDYPQYLETGTARIKPRPMWLPVVEELIPELELDLVRLIERG